MNPNGPLLHFVIAAGLLDSFNPCAIAVLLIFIALMFTLSKNRSAILSMGFVYIMFIFLTYLAIGLGLLKIITIFSIPHLIVKIGAWIVIIVGLWGLKDTLFPGKRNILAIPIGSRQLIASWATKATIPAAAVTGILVGLTEFPCSGAVYIATLTLLSSSTTFLKGLIYLIVYNFMFVLPLIVLLLIAANRMILEKMINLDEMNSDRIRVISALIMIGIGIVILKWFV
ncbi:TPA: hypothetical protein DD449_01050 [Candidatus Berkelbacteria bacterium]|uniref:Cytochrome c biogenesis transmembrane protein n=1 Tax=Berkelbacteria bacterium GW2011_GWE1_39_12 TaxID=1618337 RepID=A0A0G4B450_9BACT|nr:MAG: cytochrome c biogenesis transmembrane protein [Berkelbacteria bacterium GW2011_GWE1_39_12]HBO60259.1 hypothetical protein [Candidatus Berkelbacteria bacterium]